MAETTVQAEDIRKLVARGKAEHVIYTPYGSYRVPNSVAIVMDAAKRRRNGYIDRRTAAGKFLDRYAAVAEEAARKANLRGKKPVLPEANDI